MEPKWSQQGDRAGLARVPADMKMPRTLRAGRALRWVWVCVSLGLVVGAAVWAVQLVVRDVSGVPVIRAIEGPMRSTPTDPGGVQAAHMGLAVNLLAEGAEAGQVPDVLVLAPSPLALTALELASASRSGDPDAALADAPIPEPASPQTHELIARLIARNGLADGAAADTPTADIADTEGAASQVTPPARMQVIPASIAGVSQSIRPMLKPVALIAASAPAVMQASASQLAEIDAAGLAEGTRLVQLGAFDSAALARAEWARLTSRFPDYFTGRAPVIQQASSGGSAFFRLRAHGFEDLAASRRFCAALTAQNAPCIPVTVR